MNASILKRALGTFEVKLTSQAATDETGASILSRLLIDKQFHGDLAGIGQGEMLAARTAMVNSAGYVALERVTGSLMGRSGSFVLQHSSTMQRGEGRQSVTVIPDSGTGELAGLRGQMTIIIEDGKHRYEFEFALEG
jgi:Protein of unknown function (DUF3224)